MIRMLRSADRIYVRDGAVETWKTFDPDDRTDPLRRDFGALVELNEVSLLPGTRFKLDLDKEHEVVTYVRRGGFLARNASQAGDRLEPGCFQRAGAPTWMTAGIPQMAPSGRTHFFLSSMRVPPAEREAPCERRHFSFADRHGRLRLVAAPKGGDSLSLRQDVRLYSSLLDKGCRIVHELPSDRRAWLQMVAGRIRLDDLSLETGDGASFEGEAAVAFTTQEPSEILLFELA